MEVCMQELIDFLKLDYIFLVLNLVNIFTFIGFVYLLISNNYTCLML